METFLPSEAVGGARAMVQFYIAQKGSPLAYRFFCLNGFATMFILGGFDYSAMVLENLSF